MGFFDDITEEVTDEVDKAVDEAEDRFQGITDNPRQAIDQTVENAEKAIDKAENVAKDVEEEAGNVAKEVGEAANDIKQGATNVANEVNQGDISGVVDEATDTVQDVASGDADTGSSGENTRDEPPKDLGPSGQPPKTRKGEDRNPKKRKGENRNPNVRKGEPGLPDSKKRGSLQNQLNQTEKANLEQEIRQTINKNPGIGSQAQALRRARNTPTEEQRKRQDPIPFNPAAKLIPSREDKIQSLERQVNQRQDIDFADLNQIGDILFAEEELGDEKQADNVDFEDVQKLADKTEKADLSPGELRTLTSEESGEFIAENTEDFLKPNQNPGIEFLGTGTAAATGVAAEGINAFGNENQSFEFNEAVKVTEDEQEAFEDVTGNVIAEIPAQLTEIPRRAGQAQQIANNQLSEEAAAAAAIAATQQTIDFIEENPRKAAAGGTIGFLVSGPVGTSGFRKATGNTVDLGKAKAGDVAGKVENQLTPGGFDETTARDFIAGDLGKRPMNPDEVQNSIPEEDILMGRNVPDVQESVPTTERTRREFLKEFGLPRNTDPENFVGKEFSPDDGSKIKDILTNKRKGQAQLVSPKQRIKDKTDNILDNDNTGKDVGISDRINRIEDKIRSPDRNRDTDFIDETRLARDNDKTEFNKPEGPRNGLDTGLGLGLGLGLGQGEESGLDNPQDQGQDRDQRQPPEEEPEQDPFLEEDNIHDFESGFEELFLGPRRDRRKRREDEEDRRRRRRDRDFDIDLEESKEDEKEFLFDEDTNVDINEDTEFTGSLAGNVFGLEGVTEEEAGDRALTGLEVRISNEDPMQGL